jgi:hypothetical protein
LVSRLHAIQGNRGRVGVVIQAYLRRSAADIDRLLAEGVRIRLCKGAYQEPANLAFPDKAEVDDNFIRLMQVLLPSGVYHGIATHDEKMIEATCHFARERGIQPVPDALWGAPRSAEIVGGRRLPDAYLHSFRNRVVSLLYAEAGGAAGQPAIHRPQFLP